MTDDENGDASVGMNRGPGRTVNNMDVAFFVGAYSDLFL